MAMAGIEFSDAPAAAFALASILWAQEPRADAAEMALRPCEWQTLATPCPLAGPAATPLKGEQHRLGFDGYANAR